MSLLGELYYRSKNFIDSKKESKSIDKIITTFINDKSVDIDGIDEIKSYYQNGGKSPFPYSLEKLFNKDEIIILHDELPYVLHNKNKLYFPKNFSENKIRKLYLGLIVEQHIKSPHCYTQNNFPVPKGSTLVDIGCADGMFSLDQIDNIDQLVLFETREYWIEALNKTFKPWSNKVDIVNAYVSDVNDENNITLDSYSFKKSDHFYLKIDVEGAEARVLAGAEKFLKEQKSIQIAIATYHFENDFKMIETTLSKYSFDTRPTDGYILFYYDSSIKSPFLRHCILQGEKID